MSYPLFIHFSPVHSPYTFHEADVSLCTYQSRQNKCANRFTFAPKLIIFEWGSVVFYFLLEPNKYLKFVTLCHLFRRRSPDAPSILYTGGPVVWLSLHTVPFGSWGVLSESLQLGFFPFLSVFPDLNYGWRIHSCESAKSIFSSLSLSFTWLLISVFSLLLQPPT